MKMRKFLAILVVIAMLCSVIPAVSAEEKVIAADIEHASGWIQTEIYTTNWGGTWDPSIIVAGGALKIYLTTDITQLWQVRLCLNGNQWTELDWHVDPSQVANPCGTLKNNGDGTVVVSFAYEDMVSLYGTDDFATTLGAITIVTNGGAAATINKVVYETDGQEEPSDVIVTLDKNDDDATYANSYVAVIKEWLPDYQDGDEVTITVAMESNVYFNGGIGANVDGAWSSSYYESAANTAVASWTCVPQGDFQIQLWWTNEGCTGVNITSIVIEKVVKECAHDYTNQTPGTQVSPADCNNAAVHYVACDKCGVDSDVTISVGEALGHAWTNDCDTTCNNDCGETREITHVDENPKDHCCDICTEILGTCEDKDPVDHLCDYGCGSAFGTCEDKDPVDHLCDYGCGKKFEEHADGDDKDHLCDYCNKEVEGEEHADGNDDHLCDECETAISSCKDDDENHLCDICGKELCEGEHIDENTDHTCDACEAKVGTCEDKDPVDHLCDYGCGKSYGTCEDADKDHLCDYGCGKSYGTCEDSDKDHLCDYGCEKTYGTCEDSDKDHDCDYGCEKAYGEHADENKDHKCDYGCEDAIGDHADGDDENHTCDHCGEKISDCADEDKDHLCDECGEVLTECADEDPADHKCDLCGKELSQCADADEDLVCDICGAEIPATEPEEDEPADEEEEDEPATEPDVEIPVDENTTVIYSGNTVISSGWQMAAQVYTTNWDGELDPAVITADGELVVTLHWTTDGFWNAHLALQSTEKNAAGTDWFQISVEAADMTDNGDGTHSFAISYEELAEAYGFDDFSNLGCLYLYVNSAEGCEVTVDYILYVAAEAEEPTEPEEDEPTTEPTEPEEDEPTTEPTEPEEDEPTTEPTEPEEDEPATEPTEPEEDESTTEPTDKPEQKPSEGSVTEIYSGDTAVDSGWQMAVQVYAVTWEGPLDAAAVFTEGGYVEINLTTSTADIWSTHVVLQGTGASNGWQQIDKEKAAFVENSDGSYTITVSYDELVKAYGGSDFSDLGCFYVYTNSDAGCSVTVNSVNYVVEAAQDDDDNTGAEEPNVTTKETVVFTGEAAASANWTIITEVMTVPFEGPLDPSIMTEAGYLSVYYTGTEGQIYLALQDGTNWGWYQIDAPSTTVAVDGGYVSSFSFADLAKAYGKEDFSDLGKVIIGSANASDIVISQISWTQVSTNADTGDDSMVLLAMIVMALMAVGMVTVVSRKKYA